MCTGGGPNYVLVLDSLGRSEGLLYVKDDVVAAREVDSLYAACAFETLVDAISQGLWVGQ
jgi:hypothetical protein